MGEGDTMSLPANGFTHDSNRKVEHSKTVRILQMSWILERGERTVRELADRFNVSCRTIYRDLQILRLARSSLPRESAQVLGLRTSVSDQPLPPQGRKPLLASQGAGKEGGNRY